MKHKNNSFMNQYICIDEKITPDMAAYLLYQEFIHCIKSNEI